MLSRVKTTKDNYMTSCTHSSVYARHVYNVRVCSFYYVEWRRLVDESLLLPVDNAILKLKITVYLL